MLKDKKILITGSHGFLGKNLVGVILNEYKLDSKKIFLPKREDYDLKNIKDIEKMFLKFKPEIVIHLATTKGGFGHYKEHPGEVFYTNLIMGVQLMEVARKNNVKRVIIAGSALGYPKDAKIPLIEKDFWKGYPQEIEASYGLAHKLLCAQADFYKKEYGMDTSYLILPNLYGPGYDFNSKQPHVLPSLIIKMHSAKLDNKSSLQMIGDGSSSREFLFVIDAARLIIQSIEKENLPLPLNLGPGIEVKIKDLAEKIKKLVDYDGELIWEESNGLGTTRRFLDSSLFQSIFKNQNMTSFDEGLSQTVIDFMKNKN